MRIAIIILLSLSLCKIASAEINSDLIVDYNEAVESQDTPKIVETAKILGQAAIDNPNDPQSAVIAFETAQNLCTRGACEQAQTIAASISGDALDPARQAQLPLLQSYSVWAGSNDKESTKVLTTALMDFVPQAPTALSIDAYDTLLGAHFGANAKHKVLLRVAKAASAHSRSARDMIPTRWASFELIALSSEFNATRKLEGLPALMELTHFLSDQRDDEDSESSQLGQLYYTSSAWWGAMEALAASRNSASDRKYIKLMEQMEEAHEEEESEADDELPLCEGKFDRLPKPYYPQKAAKNGYIGNVLVGFDLVDGKAENFRVLASVPSNVFDDVVLSSMEGLEWQTDDPLAPDNCRNSTKRPAIYPFQFSLR